MSPLRVFVVDPDPRRGPWLAKLVAGHGHEVELLAHGELAIDRFVQAPADAILVEYLLPGRDGVATVEAIRWAPGGRDVRVVLLAREEPASAPLQMLALRVDATSALVGELDAARVERAVADLERGFHDEGTLALEDDSYARQMPHARRESRPAPAPGDARDWLDVATVVAGAHGGPTAEALETAQNPSFLDEPTRGGGGLEQGIPTVHARAGGVPGPSHLQPPPRPAATFDDVTTTEPGPGIVQAETVSLRALTATDARALLGIAAGKVPARPFATRAAAGSGRFAAKGPAPGFKAPSSRPRSGVSGLGASPSEPPAEPSGRHEAAAREGSGVDRVPTAPPPIAVGAEAPEAAEPVRVTPGRPEERAPFVRLHGSDEHATSEFLRDPQTVDEGRFVRAQAEVGRLGEWSGSFSTTPFPALLRRVADERASGGLVCTALEGSEIDRRLARPTVDGEPPTKVVYFRAGVPVHVRSNLVDECFGQLLLRKKRIGVATLEESIRRMREANARQGQVLVEMGALAPIELGELLAEQARQKLFDLFGWRRGEYRFAATLEVPRDGVPLEMALPDMVYEGVCAAMPATLLLDIMTPRLDLYVVPDPVRLARFARVRVARDLRVVLERLDGSMRLREVLRMGQRPGAIAQLLYALECLGAIEFEASERLRRVSLPALSVEQPLAPQAGPLEHGVPFEQAPFEQGAREPSGRMPARGAPAWDDVTTQQPERASQEPGLPTARDPARGSPAGEGSELESLSLSGLVEMDSRSNPQALPAARAEPVAWEGSTQAEGSQRPRPEAPAAVTGPRAAVPTQNVLDAHVDRMFEAERCFRRGNRSLARSEHREALAAFVRAVELCPEEGEFVAYLGWARHCVEPDSPQATEEALRDLARSTELAPDLHVTHLLRGRVLEHAGRFHEAWLAFEAVLSLEPSMTEAAEAIARLERRTR